ncbi:MAG TPA: hypothetical protein VJZ00_16440, partial [Thermoanaerobaculia bacterium]|nr:hypothetical protein [Thermoanaerobaculia bacterium]
MNILLALTLLLQRGASAEVVVHQRGTDVVVEVRDPRGALIDSVDGPTGNTGDEHVEIIASETGNYSIDVRPFDEKQPPGLYEIEVKTKRTAAETRAVRD